MMQLQELGGLEVFGLVWLFALCIFYLAKISLRYKIAPLLSVVTLKSLVLKKVMYRNID